MSYRIVKETDKRETINTSLKLIPANSVSAYKIGLSDNDNVSTEDMGSVPDDVDIYDPDGNIVYSADNDKKTSYSKIPALLGVGVAIGLIGALVLAFNVPGDITVPHMDGYIFGMSFGMLVVVGMQVFGKKVYGLKGVGQ